MEQLTDVWKLESEDQDWASEDLNHIIDKALKFEGVSERAYLRKLWDGESWQSIKERASTEGSVWYVWYMDGVNQHLRNLINDNA
tara:strand:+ start:113 stop:367 length:255 start_codon:yes stop_codon:yes gene_type:complete